MKREQTDRSQWTLPQWLEYIERLHPREIELGLNRVRQVAERLSLLQPQALVITIAGTNGKGSSLAAMQYLLQAAGYSVGSFTSPHLLHYNERVCINGEMTTDAVLCDAFSRIEAARCDTPLTYFEYGTLLALEVFRQAEPDVILLETGLGGRLDAVNIIAADFALISSIGLDHQEWLGDTRELIGREKAGIFRRGRPVVCGDDDPPQSLLDRAAELGCPLYCSGRDFRWFEQDDGQWTWQGIGRSAEALTLDALPMPSLALSNVASAMQLLELTDKSIPRSALDEGLAKMRLPGRQQLLHDSDSGLDIMLDVAHNPQAGELLARRLQSLRSAGGNVHLVLAMMADKDQFGFYRTLESQVDFWYIAQVDMARCLPAEALLDRLVPAGESEPASPVQSAAFSGPHNTVRDAWLAACAKATRGDTIVVTGSFFTVSEAMQLLADSSDHFSAR